MRDAEMVKRAIEAHHAWWTSTECTRTIHDAMANFAAAEVARARISDADSLYLSNRLNDARASRDAWQAEAEKAMAERDAAVARAEEAEARVVSVKAQRDAADVRAEQAVDGMAKAFERTQHAEARVRDLEAGAKPAPGYGVGDVVVNRHGEPRIVVALKPGDVSCKDLPSMLQNGGSPSLYTYLRPATPAERKAAGLPEDAPAPYAPKVGDRVLYCGDPGFPRVVIGVGPLRLWFLYEGLSVAPDPAPGAYTYDRPATPAERKAAGLTEDAPASETRDLYRAWPDGQVYGSPVKAPAPDLAALRAAVVDADAARTAAGNASPYNPSTYDDASAEYKRACAALHAAVKAAKGCE